MTISFTALFGVIVIALAVAAYVAVKNDAYLKLDAALQVATSATAMSAEHELSEHPTKLGGEKDLQSVLEEGGRSTLSDTQLLVREGQRIAAYKPGSQNGLDLLGLAGLAGYFLAERSLRPLKQLAQTVDAVTSSDLSARVKLSNPDDEIGTLGLRFNSLLDRLEGAFTLQRRFMSDASHQIRTPVTIALAAAQVTRRDPHANLRDCKDSVQLIE